MWVFPKLWQTVNKSYYWLTQVFIHNYYTNTMCLKIKYWSFWKYIYNHFRYFEDVRTYTKNVRKGLVIQWLFNSNELFISFNMMLMVMMSKIYEKVQTKSQIGWKSIDSLYIWRKISWHDECRHHFITPSYQEILCPLHHC